MVATSGWTERSGRTSMWGVAALFRPRATCSSPTSPATECSTGPNLDLLEEAVRAAPGPAHPGIGRDYSSISTIWRGCGTDGAIVGKALWEGGSTLREALSLPARRIIPCLDVSDGRVVKGVQFRDHRDVGDIVEQAMRYRDEGADELVFYDITASADGRSIDLEWVRTVARVIDIPFAVAGGLRTPRPGGRLPRFAAPTRSRSIRRRSSVRS